MAYLPVRYAEHMTQCFCRINNHHDHGIPLRVKDIVLEHYQMWGVVARWLGPQPG